jgi:predicted nucleic acid-binding Zn ribbon protein
MINMTEIIPQHTHCHMCGKSIPVGETLCSEECKQKFQSLVKKRKIILYLMYAMLAAFIIIIFIGPRFM